jgi:ATP-dependent protease HslVU (ClpYQ) peptidase subunit
MTVIVFDGKQMVADRRMSSGNMHETVQKIHRLAGGVVVGFSGSVAHQGAMLQWIKDGVNPEAYPGPAFDAEHPMDAEMLVVNKWGQVFTFVGGPYLVEVLSRPVVIGSGAAYVLGAMAAGADAVRAVEIASQYDPGCGNGIDVVEVLVEEVRGA